MAPPIGPEDTTNAKAGAKATVATSALLRSVPSAVMAALDLPCLGERAQSQVRFRVGARCLLRQALIRHLIH